MLDPDLIYPDPQLWFLQRKLRTAPDSRKNYKYRYGATPEAAESLIAQIYSQSKHIKSGRENRNIKAKTRSGRGSNLRSNNYRKTPKKVPPNLAGLSL
jgi:hypothetical protein